MKTSRRYFIKALAMPGAALAFPNEAYSQRGNIASNQLIYPLVTETDERTLMIPRKAEKIRELAELVIRKRNMPWLISYNPGKTLDPNKYQGVEAVILADGKRYTVWVANHNETSPLKMKDSVSFWIRPQDTAGQDSITTFSDEGLDGRVNSATIAPSLIEFNATGKRIDFDRVLRIGLENGSIAQRLYDQTVDKLLSLYRI